MARTTGIKRPDPNRAARRRRLLLVGLALFFVADIALAAVALAGSRPPAKVASQTAPSAPPESAAPTPTPTPTPTVPPVAAVLPTRILVAADASLAWRATTGACPATQATPEITTNAGAKWTSTNATTATGVRSLQSIAIEGKKVASMIGQAAQDCSVQLVRTFVAGANYEKYPAALAGSWYVNPLDRRVVHSPKGDLRTPCGTVLALARRDASNAAILCDDATLRLTTDFAATWSTPISMPGTLNIASSGTGYLAAAVGLPSCAGVQILSITGSPALKPTSTGCLTTNVAPAALSGNVALSEAAGTLWLWSGDSLSRSADGGVTWQ